MIKRGKYETGTSQQHDHVQIQPHDLKSQICEDARRDEHIVDCPESPDTRGWFARLQEAGLNFVFFVYTEPIEAMNVADDELQAILDSVRFRVTEEYLNN